MRWRTSRRSTNIEDRRGRRVGGGLPIGGGGLIIVLLLAWFMGADPSMLLSLLGGTGTSVSTPAPGPRSAADDEAADFIAAVLGETEDTWGPLFAASGSQYVAPQLVLYTDAVQSACGVNSAQTGPFYCPGDRKVYLDLGFLGELQRMGASGDFAMAYVIAHEVGHHIQNVTGVERQVRQLQAQASRTQANDLSVRMELQADCYAGVWAHHAERERDLLEQGDVEEGLRAAAAVGDDRLQRAAGQRVQPESFTHGSSEQRMQWFRTGLETGSVQACDTFGGGR